MPSLSESRYDSLWSIDRFALSPGNPFNTPHGSQFRVKPMIPSVTPQQQTFVDLYVGGMTKYEACEAAGYRNCESYARQLLGKTNVKQYVEIARVRGTGIAAKVTPELILQGIFKETHNSSAGIRLKAWDMLAKIKGLYIEQKTENNQITFSLNMDNPDSPKSINRLEGTIDSTVEPNILTHTDSHQVVDPMDCNTKKS